MKFLLMILSVALLPLANIHACQPASYGGAGYGACQQTVAYAQTYQQQYIQTVAVPTTIVTGIATVSTPVVAEMPVQAVQTVQAPAPVVQAVQPPATVVQTAPVVQTITPVVSYGTPLLYGGYGGNYASARFTGGHLAYGGFGAKHGGFKHHGFGFGNRQRSFGADPVGGGGNIVVNGNAKKIKIKRNR